MAHSNRTSKILWGEGLFLRPQHFQQQDACHEARLQELSRSLHPYGWGVRHCRFDLQALADGILRPLQLSVLFSDSEPYAGPADDALPEPLALKQLPAGVQQTVVYLALPLLRESGDNCSRSGESDGSRYRQLDRLTQDLYTDAAEAEVAYLGRNVRLLSAEQARNADVCVPLVRVRRTSSGGFELDPDFIPPCVHIAASATLLRELQSLLDALQAKADALHGLHRQPSPDIFEFRSGDSASFWLLHTLNSAAAALSHLLQHPLLAPERLHLELRRLAGALLTFSSRQQLNDLPHYQHEQPEAGFLGLFQIIRTLLETVISSRCFQIALHQTKPGFHLGRLDSQQINAQTQFYLAISADLSTHELLQAIPTRFKLGAPDDVDKCVLAALPAIRLQHAVQVPAAIPTRPGCSYFQLDPHGPLYERMLKSRSVLIYVPEGIAGLEIELIAVTA